MLRTTVDVRKLRESLHMSQTEFARHFGFRLATLQQWEQGRRQPRGAAMILLSVISKVPDDVRKALAATASA